MSAPEHLLSLQERIEFGLRSGMDNRRTPPLWGDPVEVEPLMPLYPESGMQTECEFCAGIFISAERYLWEQDWRRWAAHHEYVEYCHSYTTERAAGQNPFWAPPKAQFIGRRTGESLSEMLAKTSFELEMAR